MTAPLIIGAGLAGLSVALALAPKPVVVLGRKLAEGGTSSALAQGGIAAAVGSDDHPLLHAKDTLAAGCGLCDARIVDLVTQAAPEAIAQLAAWGVAFDRDESGAWETGLEGAHSRRRVVHAQGDATGAMVMQALVKKAKETPSITIIENVEVVGLQTKQDNEISGVIFRNIGASEEFEIQTAQVVLATGSACALWRHATVPLGSWGHGLALAARAGAILRDLEFVQFHPTALDMGCDPMPLVSEAVRGEGAHLVTKEGGSFVPDLAPRDIVARAIWAEMEKGRRVYLDARPVASFAARFPTISTVLQNAGLDPSVDLIPIRPAAHYHMGGVATDAWGRTNIKGLWACGEGACTGLHGANRLASNSLLEAVVMGRVIGEDLKPHVRDEATFLIRPTALPLAQPAESPEDIDRIRDLMSAHLGVRRTREGLEMLIANLTPLAARSPRALVGLMIAKAALARRESRGAHERTDFPEMNANNEKPLHVALKNGALSVGD